MNHDRLTVWAANVVACLRAGRLVRRANLAARYAVGFAFAWAVVAPASAEWSTVTDRAILGNIGSNTLNTANGIDITNDWLDVIHGRLTGMHTDLTQSEAILGDIRTSNQSQELTLTQIYDAMAGTQQVEVVNFDEITVHIDEMEQLTQLLVDNTLNSPGGGHSVGYSAVLTRAATQDIRWYVEQINRKMDQLTLNTDPGSGVNTPTVPGQPDLGLQPNVAQPNFVPTPQRAGLDWYVPEEDVPEFEDPENLEVEPLEWTPPTRTGLQVFAVSIPTSQLSSATGLGGIPDLTFSADMSWYGGTVRTLVHAALLGLLGIGSGFFIFEEFRRYA